MPYSVIDSPKKYFDTVTYTGNGASPRSIGNLSFKPDFVWSKSRSTAENHNLYDAVRGGANSLRSNLTNAENASSIYGYVSSFNTDGVTYISGGTNNDLNNANGVTFVNWNWLGANTTVSNTSGTISSTVSANTTSGFSIVSYTGNGTSGATIGHGLGVAPAMIILKSRGTAGTNWQVGHKSLSSTPWNSCVRLNNTVAIQTASSLWNNTAPTSSVFTIGNDSDPNTNSSAYIAYCFAEVKGFSKAFSYTGNGSTDGSYVYCGFRPAFLMYKNTSTAGTDWVIIDTKRDTFNVATQELYPSGNYAEGTASNNVDILSNGFKARRTNSAINGSGSNYIGIAFATNPFVSSKGIPACAV